MELVKQNRPALQKFKIDELLKNAGHSVLRLPPYHPDLNPIENIWGIVKHAVASRNVNFNLNDVIKLTNEEFGNEIYVGHWRKSCAKAWNVENTYYNIECGLEEIDLEEDCIDLDTSTEST